jgi:hypothetical protein
MNLRYHYLGLCVIGIVLPYWQFAPWLLEHGPDLRLFFHELIANRISGFFAMDVIISAVVLLLFIQSEGKRLRMRSLWLPTIGTLMVGVSLGLPLFLYLREVALDQTSREA